MIYVNEFEFFKEEGMVCAVPFGLEGGTCGTDLDNAVFMAADWLYETVKYDLIHGEIPQSGGFGHRPERGGIVIAVSVQCDLADVEVVSAAEAARILGVSTARVAQMCAKGLLVSWKEGRSRKILRESVAARLQDAPQPGRPRRSRQLVEA